MEDLHIGRVGKGSTGMRKGEKEKKPKGTGKEGGSNSPGGATPKNGRKPKAGRPASKTRIRSYGGSHEERDEGFESLGNPALEQDGSSDEGIITQGGGMGVRSFTPNQGSPSIIIPSPDPSGTNGRAMTPTVVAREGSVVMREMRLKSVPSEVHINERLRVLDLSFNLISALPLESIHLPVLETLNLSHNRISSLPEHWAAWSLLPRLRELDISSNNLQELPHNITKLDLERLDISNNHLTLLPEEIAFMAKLFQLNVKNNQLIFPPQELSDGGLESIRAFFEQASSPKGSSLLAEVPSLALMHIVIVGSRGTGKSQLAKILCGNRTPSKKGIKLDVYPWFALDPQRMEVLVYDVGFESTEITSYHRFVFSERALYLIVWNMEHSSPLEIEEEVEEWIECIQCQCGGQAMIKIIATHADKLSQIDLSSALNEMKRRLSIKERQRKRHLQELPTNLESVSNGGESESTLLVLLFRIDVLGSPVIEKLEEEELPEDKKAKNAVRTMQSVEALQAKLRSDLEVLQKNAIRVPPTFHSILATVRTYRQILPLVTMKVFMQLCWPHAGEGQENPNDQFLRHAICFLSTVGEVLYLEKFESEYIVLDPLWLVDCIDFLGSGWDERAVINGLMKTHGISSIAAREHLDRFNTFAYASSDLLSVLWFAWVDRHVTVAGSSDLLQRAWKSTILHFSGVTRSTDPRVQAAPASSLRNFYYDALDFFISLSVYYDFLIVMSFSRFEPRVRARPHKTWGLDRAEGYLIPAVLNMVTPPSSAITSAGQRHLCFRFQCQYFVPFGVWEKILAQSLSLDDTYFVEFVSRSALVLRRLSGLERVYMYVEYDTRTLWLLGSGYDAEIWNLKGFLLMFLEVLDRLEDLFVGLIVQKKAVCPQCLIQQRGFQLKGKAYLFDLPYEYDKYCRVCGNIVCAADIDQSIWTDKPPRSVLDADIPGKGMTKQVEEKIKNAVCIIGLYDTEQRYVKVASTAFYIKGGMSLATCSHTLYSYENVEDTTGPYAVLTRITNVVILISDTNPEGKATQWQYAAAVTTDGYFDPESSVDIATLKLTHKVKASALVGADGPFTIELFPLSGTDKYPQGLEFALNQEVRPSELSWLYGYTPKTSRTLNTFIGRVTCHDDRSHCRWMIVDSSNPGGTVEIPTQDVHYLVVNVYHTQGCSGGPCVLGDGRVIGLLSLGQEHLAYVIPASSIHRVISKKRPPLKRAVSYPFIGGGSRTSAGRGSGTPTNPANHARNRSAGGGRV